MTEKQHVARFEFENMTPQDEVFLRQKFNLNKTDSIDASLEQELTTSMRIDLFYQTAECRLTHTDDGVRVTLSAGNRKSVQLHAGVRFDSEGNAALQFELDFPLKSAMPINADFTIRLGKTYDGAWRDNRSSTQLHPSYAQLYILA
jgi:NTE family protein